MKRFIYSILCLLLLAPLALPLRALAASPNLIANASVETSNNNQPTNWTSNSWGSNTAAFSYQTTGHTGSRSLGVTVTNYSSGDAKWIPDVSAVTAGQSYTYTDYSQSTAVTELDAAYTDATGKMTFAYLQSIPASSSWQQTSSTFTIPTGMVGVSVFHILYSNGTLQTDDFSLAAYSQPAPPPPPPAGSNLIANNSFETASGSLPASWQHSGWGSNTSSYGYLSGTAHTGTRSAKVTVSSYTDGDVKWAPDPVSVSAGNYTYQDYYKATVATRVVVAMTDASGVASYTEMGGAAVSASWKLYSTTFSVPSGVQTVQVYHLLDKVGNLTIDDVSLVANPPLPPTTNLVPNPSFETVNGIAPADWSGQGWGSNTATFKYVQTDGHTGTSSAKVTISNYVSGDAKWAFTPLTSLTAGSQYSLSAWYKTNTAPHVVADFVDANGVDNYRTLPNPLPASGAATTWQSYNATLDVPDNTVSTTVYFLVSSNGWLQTDDVSLIPVTPVGFQAAMVSLTFDDGWQTIYDNGLPILQKYGMTSTQYLISGELNQTGYMSTAMAQAFATSGSEIASHTVTHPDLTRLTSTQLKNELANSQTTLRKLFGSSVANNFASPYGTYNTTTLTQIKKYYQSHRSTDVGYNTKDNFNPYNILVQNVDMATTPAEVASWVAKAKAENAWLVLVYHNVSTSTDPNDYAVTPANLDIELNNIATSGVAVKTMSQALAAIASQP